MLFVIGVGEDLFQLGVAPRASAVFRWASPFGGDQEGIVDRGIGIEDILDEDLVLPAVAEVIRVTEPITDAYQFVDRDLALVTESELRIGDAEDIGVAREAVHMVV